MIPFRVSATEVFWFVEITLRLPAIGHEANASKANQHHRPCLWLGGGADCVGDV